ncbi:MAG TPA: cytochrome c3 family protein [Candidatus Methanoperedens sp.]|nr:cytochrome c3 family protein [Candidatus Methanoperedens sp.]
MRRSRAPLALAAAALALCADPCRAAIEGSPHDIIAHGYDMPKSAVSQDRCNRCHLAAVGPILRGAVLPPALAGRWSEAALLCFSCHDGTTIVSREVDASLTAFHPDAHGSDVSQLESFDPTAIGLGAFEGGRLSCTTCHDSHDDGKRPFLRVELREICLGCHSQQNETGTREQNLSGNHPLGMDPAAAPRPEVPIAVEPEFRTPFPGAYPLRGGKAAEGVHWDLGGHLDAGAAGLLGCPTCHAVHGDERLPPRKALLAKEPGLKVADFFCEGCHAGTRGDDQISDTKPNPGGTRTGRTYHPCDDDAANGDGRIIDVREPEGWPLGEGTPAKLLCSTCHRAHQARVGVGLLRPPVEATAFCEECHREMPLEYHHPTGPDVDGPCADQVPRSDTGEPGTLSCGLCHRAHNAGRGAEDEHSYIPLLREARDALAQCLPCHPSENPTCSDNKDGLASHFVGDPVSSETYNDPNPPLWTDPWPESGLFSTYGGPDKKIVLCLSCHSFDRNAVVSGDKGTSGRLLARSGNPVEWTEVGTYLCTGCHGTDPATGKEDKGHSHPMMAADLIGKNIEPVAPASGTLGGKMNCDSCHRPHEARTASGYYILESVHGSNTDPKVVHPDIDYAVLCRLCHIKF